MSEPVELPPMTPYDIRQFLQKRFSGGRSWLPNRRIILGTHQWFLSFVKISYPYRSNGMLGYETMPESFEMRVYWSKKAKDRWNTWYVQEDGTFSKKPYNWVFNKDIYHFVLPDLIEALEFADRCEKAFFKKRGQAMVCRKCPHQLSCLAQSE